MGIARSEVLFFLARKVAEKSRCDACSCFGERYIFSGWFAGKSTEITIFGARAAFYFAAPPSPNPSQRPKDLQKKGPKAPLSVGKGETFLGEVAHLGPPD